MNCPTAGYFRTVEVLGTAADSASNRCLVSAYPFPADDDVTTRPNYDGPPRVLPLGATVTAATIEFRADGTAYEVVNNVAQTIATEVTVTVTRNSKTKVLKVNGSGKIQLQ
jgi:hypothetical protein